MKDLDANNYVKRLIEVKQRIRTAQYEALKVVNKQLIALYWDIGKLIITRQQGETWGKSVVNQLAKDLQTDFPGIQGFSTANLWRMKLFYQTYADNEKLAPMVREIGWTHNLVIIEKCKDSLEREFYIRSTKKFGWTKNVLIHQIENQSYEKTLLNQINFEQTVPEDIKKQAKLAIKDEYTFDFLELADEHSERQLEQAILARVEPFLQEMGGMFAFVGSQYRLEVGDEEYYIINYQLSITNYPIPYISPDIPAQSPQQTFPGSKSEHSSHTLKSADETKTNNQLSLRYHNIFLQNSYK